MYSIEKTHMKLLFELNECSRALMACTRIGYFEPSLFNEKGFTTQLNIEVIKQNMQNVINAIDEYDKELRIFEKMHNLCKVLNEPED